MAVALSMYFCGSSIREIVIDWHQNPVKLVFADKPTPISKIPFPAITVCPMNIADSEKVNANSIEDFIERGESNDSDEGDE